MVKMGMVKVKEATGEGGISEEEMKEIYEIYKEQEYLKQQLEKQLQDMIKAGDKTCQKAH